MSSIICYQPTAAFNPVAWRIHDNPCATVDKSMTDSALLFARRLDEIMRATGDTNYKVAAEIGVNEAFVSRLRNGRMKSVPWDIVQILLERYAGKPGGILSPREAAEWTASIGITLPQEYLKQLFPETVFLQPLLLPPRLPNHYVARSTYEDQISAALEATAPLVLVGMGGTGKTVLARAIANRLQHRFRSGVLWLEMPAFDHPTDLHQHVLQKLDLFTSNDNDVNTTLQAWLYANAFLVCLDDLSLIQCQWVRHWFPPGGLGRILITTRDRLVAAELEAVDIFIGVMQEDESLDLLRRWAGHSFDSQADERDNHRIAHDLGHLPLALKMVGAQMHSGADLAETPIAQGASSTIDDPQHAENTLPSDDQRLADWLGRWALSNLSDDERLRFFQTAVFQGPFDLPRAAAVWNLPLTPARHLLRQFMRFGLLDRDNESYRLHPLLKEYGAAQLARDSGRQHHTRRRHAAWYVRRALYHPKVLKGTTETAPDLEPYWSDVVAAVRWAAEHDPRIAGCAALVAHTERTALLESVGASLKDAVHTLALHSASATEQALWHDLLGDLQMMSGETNPAALSFGYASCLWEAAKDYLAASRSLLRVAGAYLVDGDHEGATAYTRHAQYFAARGNPPEGRHNIDLMRQLIYLFDIIYTSLAKYPLLDEQQVAELAQIASASGIPSVKARGLHIYRVWCTIPDVERSQEKRELGRALSVRAASIWRECGRRDRAEKEISQTSFWLKNRYTRRAAARYARRRSRTTPKVNPDQIPLLQSSAMRWWLSATEDQRVQWLSRMHPRYLQAAGAGDPLAPESKAWYWIQEINSKAMLGGEGRRLATGLPRPQGHLLDGPQWLILTGQKAMHVAGEAAETVIRAILDDLDAELNLANQ
jgi:DNA-binding Xre family transcriptional regulator